MASVEAQQGWIDEVTRVGTTYLQKFRLYETHSNFYIIGRDKNRTSWRVLKIDRLDPAELNVTEDSTKYSEIECCDLLNRIHDGNKSTGGLKFVTAFYGIVGFVKFLGPYYMLLVTKRRKIGLIYCHPVYAVAKSEMIPIPNSSVRSNMAYSKNENRYKKLLCAVDLKKDFFFSYSYHVMHSLQRNFSSHDTGQLHYETMFVWNEFLTSGIRNQLKNSHWTVALVYGYFKQVELSIAGRNFKLTLIARRSRHYAGTRYLKRGLNERGHVANDVETEQIVFEDVHEGCSLQISSVVQNRGSIPLFWSQETSPLNIKPDIILSKKDYKYEATRLHFENLVGRYGNPIIILNLVKTKEKRPRESLLRAEFANAIALINKDLPEEIRLRFLHWDLNKCSRNDATNVLEVLGRVASYALDLTGFFYYQVTPTSSSREMFKWDKDTSCIASGNLCNGSSDANSLETRVSNGSHDMCESLFVKPSRYQKGVLRTNCIDCLDRTNVAQYACGWVALGHQLYALGYIDGPSIDLDSPLADDLMRVYEKMGDTLALQYGGSAAHNKVFSQRRGQWKAATQSQEFFRTLQRYYSNVYMDAEKQDAINLFLGHYQPKLGKPALWKLDSSRHYNVGSHNFVFAEEDARSSFKRSLSEGNILRESHSDIEITIIEKNEELLQQFSAPCSKNGLSGSSPEISTCERYSFYSRFTHSMSGRQLLPDLLPEQYQENDNMLLRHSDSFNCSNFLDVELLSSSGNSCEEDTFERSTLLCSPTAGLSSDDVVNELKVEAGVVGRESESSLKGREKNGSDGTATKSDILAKFSERFVHWVTYGDILFP